MPDEAVGDDNHKSNREEISKITQLSGYILKISDMGLSKQLDTGDGSFASMSMSMPSHMPSGTNSSAGKSKSESESESIV